MANYSLVPVDHDPFAQPAPSRSGGQSFSLIPVDHDPFADAPSQPAASPTGFATRSQREGSDADIRSGVHLADAVRMRQQQDQSSPMGRLDAYTRGVASWVPGMDKLAAAGNAVFGQGQGESFGERYTDNLARERAIDTADAALFPGSRMAGQGAGLAATAAVLPSVNLIREGVRGAATVNAGATGALYGAATGAIENDGGIGDKATAGLQSGGIGLALGGAAPSVISGAGRLAGAVAAPFRSVGAPQSEAGRRVADALARDGIDDPAIALANMQRGGAPAVAGDVGGETTRALARSAANTSPEGRDALNAAVSDRFAGQADRVTEMLRGLGPANAHRTIDELQDAARRANRPAYAHAYTEGSGGLWTTRLNELAQAPAVQDAMRNVVKTAANKTVVDGMPPVRNPFVADAAGNLRLARNTDGSIARPNLQFWDHVQRDLRGRAGMASRSGNDELARDFTNLRRALLDELDAAVPSFQQARSGAARAFEAEDALEAGQNFVTSRMSNMDGRKAFSRLGEHERKLFAEGFRSRMIERIREIGDGRDVIKAVFGSPAARERVEIALGKQQAAQLHAALEIESTMLRLQEAVKGNSSTIRQMMEVGMAGSAGGLTGLWQGGDMNSAGAGVLAGVMARNVLRRGQIKVNQGIAESVAKILAEGDPVQVRKVLQSATRSPAMLRLVQGIGDEAASRMAVLSGTPAQPALGPGTATSYLPATADQNQR